MADRLPYGLLLEEMDGYKKQESYRNGRPSVSFQREKVLKGTLLIALSHEESKNIAKHLHHVHNYKPVTDMSVSLCCDIDQVFQITREQRDKIHAVRKLEDRLKAVHKLDWIDGLHFGSYVYVTIPASTATVRGVIRHIGKLQGEIGTMFGVELMERRGEGTHTGTYGDEDLFECDPDCAVYVSMDKISQYLPVDATVSKPQPPPQLIFKVDDQVIVVDKHGTKVKGKVRWIGKHEKIDVIGIEAEKQLAVADFPDHIHNLKQKNCFTVTKHGRTKLFLPKDLVKKYTSVSKELVNVETEAMRAVRENKLLEQQQKNRKNQNVKVDQQNVVGDDTLKELKEAGIQSSELASLTKKQQHYEEKQRRGSIKGKGNKEMLEHQRGVKEAKDILKLQDLSSIDVSILDIKKQQELLEEVAHQKVNKDSTNTDTVVGSVQAKDNSKPNNGSMNPDLDSHSSPTNQNPQQMWIPNPGYKNPVQSHGDISVPHTPKSSQQDILNHLQEGSAGTAVIVSQPRRQNVNEVTSGLARSDNKPQHMPSQQAGMPQDKNPYNLEKGSLVQFGNPPCYGVIKWIGSLPEIDGIMAGVEVEDDIAGYKCCDGWHQGFQYYQSQINRGYFVPLSGLYPDKRFFTDPNEKKPNPLKEIEYVTRSYVRPPSKPIHLGKGKGIQGHENSCYLDATLFGIFAFSDAFDNLLVEDAAMSKHETCKVQKIIRDDIVYPLRLNGVVLYDHVRDLRKALNEMLTIDGIMAKEKDPEEFLNLLFKHVLTVDSFLKIRRPSGMDSEFFVQLFVEPGEGIDQMPNTQYLLHKMFKEQKITFAEYPSRLLLQMPRYGKKFKSFTGIIPSLELDISEICNESFTDSDCELCHMCGRIGKWKCSHCDDVNSTKPIQLYFCTDCNGVWHNHPSRKKHTPVPVNVNEIGRLQLLSVLCIETSHYVCFTRIMGSEKDEWVFFDSMAERPDDQHNLPCVRRCTNDIRMGVYNNNNATTKPLEMLPNLARRFVRDIYLCIYFDPDGIMYQ